MDFSPDYCNIYIKYPAFLVGVVHLHSLKLHVNFQLDYILVASTILVIGNLSCFKLLAITHHDTIPGCNWDIECQN